MNYHYLFWNFAACFTALLAGVYLFRHLLGKYLENLHFQQTAVEGKLDKILETGVLDSHAIRQLRRIDDIVAMLDNHIDSDTYKNDVVSLNQQLSTISGKLDAIAETAIDVATIRHHLIKVNESLEKVLWMFRFDAGQYEQTRTAVPGNPVGSATDTGASRHNTSSEAMTAAGKGHPAADPPENSGKPAANDGENTQHPGPAFENRLSAKEMEEVQKLKTVLDESKSSYDAMMEYMRLSGKGGYEALKLLQHAGGPEKR